MATVMQKMSLATIGVAAATFGSMAPVNATGLAPVTLFTFGGTTGGLPCDLYGFYPEYQHAQFTGSFTVSTEAEGFSSEDSPGVSYKISNFRVELKNSNYPSFRSVFTPLEETEAFVTLGSFFVKLGGVTTPPAPGQPAPPPPPTDFQITNRSNNDPTRGALQLAFSDVVGDPNFAPTAAPSVASFLASRSFLTLRGSANAPQVSIPIVSGHVEAVPEPTTMAGLGVFGLGMLLKRRSSKANQKAN